MPGPITSILDTFNRADEDPLSDGGAWTTVTGLSGLKVVSNQLATSAEYASSYRGLCGPDVEVFATLGNIGSPNDFALMLRVRDRDGVSPIRGANRDCYLFFFDGGVSYLIYRVDNGVSTALGSLTNWAGGALVAGDKVGGRVVGSTLEVWAKRGAADWAKEYETSDATYGYAGALSLDQQTGVILDDFGGGTIVSAPIGWTSGT